MYVICNRRNVDISGKWPGRAGAPQRARAPRRCRCCGGWGGGAGAALSRSARDMGASGSKSAGAGTEADASAAEVLPAAAAAAADGAVVPPAAAVAAAGDLLDDSGIEEDLFATKPRRNPLVPLGALVTTAVLCTGAFLAGTAARPERSRSRAPAARAVCDGASGAGVERASCSPRAR